MLKIYGNKISLFTNKVLYTANALELDYEFIPIALFKNEQKEEAFQKINEIGKVPAIDDDGFCLSESNAIIRYLAKKTDSPLYSGSIKEIAVIDRWIDFGTLHVTNAMMKIFFSTLIAPVRDLEPDERSVKEGYAWLKTRFLSVLEKQLSSSLYLAGPALTLADIVLLAGLDPVDIFEIDLSPYPKLTAWRAQLMQADWYKQCHNSFEDEITALK